MDVLSQSLSLLIDQAVLFLPRLAAALVVFVVSLYLSGLAAGGVSRALRVRKTDPELSLLLVRLTKGAVIVVGAIIALQQVNFDLTAFLAGLGIVGFTIGFALQDVSKNLAAGVLLLIQQPFNIGDAVEVGEHAGVVTDISMRATELRTWDGVRVLIPNGEVFVKATKIFSHAPRRRLTLRVGVAYNSDLDLVSRTVQSALESIPGVVTDDPAPKVVFENFGDSSINLSAYFWIDTEATGYWDAQDQSIKVVKSAFEKAGVEIPFPVRTIVQTSPTG